MIPIRSSGNIKVLPFQVKHQKKFSFPCCSRLIPINRFPFGVQSSNCPQINAIQPVVCLETKYSAGQMNPLPPSITVAAQKTSGKHQSSHQYGLEQGRSLNLRLLFLFVCVVTVAANCIETTQCQEGELSKEKIEAFRQAVIKGDLNTVEGLVSEITTSSAVMYRDDEGRSFLHLAVIHGHDKIVERFLKPVVFGLDLYDNDGLTALHWAIHQGNKRIVTLLLKHGASLIGTSHGSYNVSPIEMAVACGNPEIFEIVQEYVRSKVQHVSEKFGTLLHVAILNKESQMLAYLLKERKEIRNDIEKKGFKGMTPLQLAASTGNERAIEILVKIGRASVDAGEHQEGGTALHYAAKAYHADTMDLLYRFGANLDAKDNSSNTALSLLNLELSEDRKTLKNLELSKDGKTLENIKPSDGKEIAARQLCVNRLRARLNEASYEKGSRPIYDKHLPQNLVFSGGAGKGIAYVGVLKKLDKRKLLSELVRTGGTSVGSIIAGLCSVGYTPNEIEEVMLSLDFTDLLDFRKESVGFLYSVYLLISSLWGGKRLDSPQKLLGKIVTYTQKISKRALSADSIGQAFVQETAEELVKVCYDFHNAAGLAEGEKLRLEVERLIAHKTGIDYLTFGELNELTKKNPEKYKHLHVIATAITKDNHPQIKRFASENLEKEELAQVIISDAIVASSSIPGIYKPHVIHIKFEGRRTPLADCICVDGGILCNNPLNIFDKKYYHINNISETQTNYRTLGLSFQPEGIPCSKVEGVSNLNSIDVTKNIMWAYYNAQELLMNMEEPQRRVINIRMDLGLIESTSLDKERKLNYIHLGEKSAGEFFSSSSEAQQLVIKEPQRMSGSFGVPWKYEIFGIKPKTSNSEQEKEEISPSVEIPKIVQEQPNIPVSPAPPVNPVLPAPPVDKEPSFAILDKNGMIRHFPNMRKNHHNANRFHVDTNNGIVITEKKGQYHVYNGWTGQSLSGAIGDFAHAVQLAKNAINGRF